MADCAWRIGEAAAGTGDEGAALRRVLIWGAHAPRVQRSAPSLNALAEGQRRGRR